MEDIIKKIYEVYKDAKIKGIKEDDYQRVLNPGLILAT